jgi:hypothetical protein
MASPLYRDHDEYYEVDGERRDGLVAADFAKDETGAVCTFWRQGKQLPVTRRFSIGHAKKAGLWGKAGPWQNYPDRMMLQRARGFAGRDTFPDLLRGIKTAEEALDIAPDENQPIETTTVQPRRASETRTAPVPATPRPATTPSSEPAPPPTASAPASSAPAAELQEIRGLKVVSTRFVRPQAGGEPFYEIGMKTTTGAERIFLTRDETVYKEAASFEGTEHLVIAGYHEGVRAGQQAKVAVLDRIAIYEGAAPAAAGELFS